MQIDIDVPSNVRVAAALKGGPEHDFFTVMDGVTVKEDRNKYPDFVFLFKGDSLVMGIEKLKDIWCSYGLLWSKIEPHFDYSYGDTQRFVKRMVEEHFKLKGVKPKAHTSLTIQEVEEHFKLRDVTPTSAPHPVACQAEEHFKLRDVTPRSTVSLRRYEVEEHFKLKGVTPSCDKEIALIRAEEHFKLKDVVPGLPFLTTKI